MSILRSNMSLLKDGCKLVGSPTITNQKAKELKQLFDTDPNYYRAKK